MSSLRNMQDLMVDELRDIYSAERQLLDALPRLAKAAKTPSLGRALSSHLAETERHVSRLDRVFEALGEPATGKQCKAMAGLIEEGAEMIEQDGDGAVRDAGIISAAQRTEHYEISAYGTAIAHAETLGRNDVARLLKESLEEEKAADKTLTTIAEEEVNLAALGAGGTKGGPRVRH